MTNTNDDLTSEIQNFVNLNELTEDSAIISEIKWCQEQFTKPKFKNKPFFQSSRHNAAIKQKWYVNYKMSHNYEKWEGSTNKIEVDQSQTEVWHEPT